MPRASVGRRVRRLGASALWLVPCLAACADLAAFRHELRTAGYEVLDAPLEQYHQLSAPWSESRIAVFETLLDRANEEEGLFVLPRPPLSSYLTWCEMVAPGDEDWSALPEDWPGVAFAVTALRVAPAPQGATLFLRRVYYSSPEHGRRYVSRGSFERAFVREVRARAGR